MTAPVTRYPLMWPQGWARTPRGLRKRATFGRTQQPPGRSWRSKESLTVSQATDRLMLELDRLRAVDVVLSTNLVVRIDGLPRSGQPEPTDPGVAVYFTLKKADRCLACDRWDRVADNIAALADHVGALRGIDRWGVGTVDQAFTGYTALPPAAADWAIVFGLASTATIEQVESAFRRLAVEAHPDRGGSHEAMARLTAAREAARVALVEGRTR
jgi:hypothetical protein